MPIVVIGTNKGGVGKTAVTKQLGFYCAQQKKRVLLIDFDVQGNLSDSLAELAASHKIENPTRGVILSSHLLQKKALPSKVLKATPYIDYIRADKNLAVIERKRAHSVIELGKAHIEQLGSQYDVVLIDLGPTVSNLQVAALSAAGYTVSPCEPTAYSRKGVAVFLSNVARVRSKYNPKIQPLGILPNRIRKDLVTHIDNLAKLRSDYGAAVMPVVLYERLAIQLAEENNQAVWRTTRGEAKSAAAQEVKAACAYIYTKIGV